MPLDGVANQSRINNTTATFIKNNVAFFFNFFKILLLFYDFINNLLNFLNVMF